jgi:chloramphenicol O-acetyltransferase
MVELGYNDLGLSDISFITLHTQWYQLIQNKARVFLPRLLTPCIRAYNNIASHRFQYTFQEVVYFENSTIS